VVPGLFRSFKKSLKAPAFLQGFFELVFDRVTGRILNEPDVVAIEGIRQVAYTFKKLQVPCSPNRVARTLDQFKQTEQFLRETEIAPGDISIFTNISRVLWSTVFGNQGDNLDPYTAIPSHGPGATADRLTGNGKYQLTQWHERLEPYFPIIDNLIPNGTFYQCSELDKVSLVPLDQEIPMRVTTVPKTLKAPRIIAMEPTCVQYAQQALKDKLYSLLETHYLTAGHVNFTDQSINRRLAIKASADGKLATLDLSSASDLVPYEIALSMFDCHPDLRDSIDACRSRLAQMPDGDILHLQKFAPMGSALCFPVEAMYFYTICIAARLRIHNLPVTAYNIYQMSRQIYVYGDDIIVPTDEADIVIETLHKYCCKVNTTKSFWSGKFRESCGMDAYDGYEVTPTYLRNVHPDNWQNASEVVSTVAACNQFYKRGYWQTADYLRKVVERVIGKLPITLETSPGLGLHSYQRRYSIGRWGKRYHRAEVNAVVPTPVYQKSNLDGVLALTKCLARPEASESPLRDPKHLVRSARHGAVTLKRRWVTPY
jgi:hypothetical protein